MMGLSSDGVGVHAHIEFPGASAECGSFEAKDLTGGR